MVEHFIKCFQVHSNPYLSSDIVYKYYYVASSWTSIMVNHVLLRVLIDMGFYLKVPGMNSLFVEFEKNKVDVVLKNNSENIIIPVEHENNPNPDFSNLNNEIKNLKDIYDKKNTKMVALFTYDSNERNRKKNNTNVFINNTFSKLNDLSCPFLLFIGYPPYDFTKDKINEKNYINWAIFKHPFGNNDIDKPDYFFKSPES